MSVTPIENYDAIIIGSGRVAYLARRASDYGVQVGPVLVNLTQVRRRKREIVSDLSGGS